MIIVLDEPFLSGTKAVSCVSIFSLSMRICRSLSLFDGEFAEYAGKRDMLGFPGYCGDLYESGLLHT